MLSGEEPRGGINNKFILGIREQPLQCNDLPQAQAKTIYIRFLRERLFLHNLRSHRDRRSFRSSDQSFLLLRLDDSQPKIYLRD